MRTLVYYFICLLILTSCQESDTPAIPSNIFDIVEFANGLKAKKIDYSNVRLISDNGIYSDTIIFNNFSIDSIVPLIRSFNFSKRERANAFDIKESKIGQSSCLRYEIKVPSNIEFLSVCKNGEIVESVTGKKSVHSILSSLEQSFQFTPSSSFKLTSTYIDKISRDTLNTRNNLMWNIKK